jgi:predicted dinucleotide-binding enzyme
VRIGVLGTGAVGTKIASRLVELGHEVMLGSRTADNENAAEWVAGAGNGASQGTFADAAAFGELLFNCTPGSVSVEAIGTARPEDVAGKTLVDISNAIEVVDGSRVVLVSPTDSLGEQLQRALPETRVVKTLNTVNNAVMVEPRRVPGDHDLFVCGNDDAAKAEVVQLLKSFGWPAASIHDLGDITGARALEAYVVLWIRLRGALGTGAFNIHVVS